MDEPITIIPEEELHESMDFARMRKEGIAYVQELASNGWTDYNLHDPGVTILENVCYALTELGYKTTFTIEEFIKDAIKKEKNHAFYTAEQVFPCHPFTINDYRKLFIYHFNVLFF